MAQSIVLYKTLLSGTLLGKEVQRVFSQDTISCRNIGNYPWRCNLFG